MCTCKAYIKTLNENRVFFFLIIIRWRDTDGIHIPPSSVIKMDFFIVSKWEKHFHLQAQYIAEQAWIISVSRGFHMGQLLAPCTTMFELAALAEIILNLIFPACAKHMCKRPFR